jgi:excisionase family DNA binding protein
MVTPAVAPPSGSVVPPGFHHESDQGLDRESLGEYTIAEAAQLLGVHPNTIRRWLRKGRLPSRMAEGPGGQEHHIPADAIRSLAARQSAAARPPIDPGSTATPSGVAPGFNNGQTTARGVGIPESAPWSNHESDHRSDQGAPEAGVATDLQPIQRAREMAEYTERLLAPWRQRVEEQAEQVGRLTVELEHARKQIAAFEAATDELEKAQEAATAEALRRPWWRFWG